MPIEAPQVLVSLLERANLQARWIEHDFPFARLEGESLTGKGLWYIRANGNECVLYAFSHQYFPGTGSESDRFNLAIELLKANFQFGPGRVGIVEHGDQKILGLVCQTAFYLREVIDDAHVHEFSHRVDSLRLLITSVDAAVQGLRR